MPTAASATTSPSRTSANANTSTHETAKNKVVNRISKLLNSIATSLRSTSSAIRVNILSPHQIAVSSANAGLGPRVRFDASAADEHDTGDEAVSEIEIVHGHEDDGA